MKDKIDLKDFENLIIKMNDSDLMSQLEDMTIEKLDQSFITGLDAMLIKLPENIRILTLGYFQYKSDFLSVKRRLELREAEIIKELDKEQSRNEELRKSYIRTDEYWQELKEQLDDLSILVEKTEQFIWVWRHIETNIRAVADLRTTEMKKLGSDSMYKD